MLCEGVFSPDLVSFLCNVFPGGSNVLGSPDSRGASEAAPALDGLPVPDNGVDEKLDTRGFPRGGCGNELILIVFRNVFPALFTAGGRTLDNAGDGVGLELFAVDSRGAEGDLRPVLGDP